MSPEIVAVLRHVEAGHSPFTGHDVGFSPTSSRAMKEDAFRVRASLIRECRRLRLLTDANELTEDGHAELAIANGRAG